MGGHEQAEASGLRTCACGQAVTCGYAARPDRLLHCGERERLDSPSLLREAHAADQHIRRSRQDPVPWPSAMRPCASGFVHGRG